MCVAVWENPSEVAGLRFELQAKIFLILNIFRDGNIGGGLVIIR
jgi:hypothetical protein